MTEHLLCARCYGELQLVAFPHLLVEYTHIQRETKFLPPTRKGALGDRPSWVRAERTTAWPHLQKGKDWWCANPGAQGHTPGATLLGPPQQLHGPGLSFFSSTSAH